MHGYSQPSIPLILTYTEVAFVGVVVFCLQTVHLVPGLIPTSCIITNLFLPSQHQEKPYCNGCYQLLFGQEGFRNGGVHVTSKIGPDAVNKQPAPET